MQKDVWESKLIDKNYVKKITSIKAYELYQAIKVGKIGKHISKPWSQDGVPVLRPDCPIFQPQVLPQLLTKSEDGADPTSDLPELLTIKYHL